MDAATDWSPQLILTLVLGILSPIAAFIGIWLGKTIERKSNLRITQLQVQAQIELTERLRWMDDFRTTVAHILSLLDHFILLPRDDPNAEIEPETKEHYATYDYHRTRLRLMLHPTKPSQQKVRDLVGHLFEHTDKRQWQLFGKIRQQLLEASETLLKKEWDDIQDKAVGSLASDNKTSTKQVTTS